ncbi:glycosyltransferase [Nocardioides sp.]|uniref:glycosyltransferase n=1 Tax=Nocardioides sp. TaxID=35761 RepID=UPI0027172881|nr:glycosyltransferase [Nocardioides sp.]MDO9454970.1 glycosyltransferase [Nocardioides sp.]
MGTSDRQPLFEHFVITRYSAVFTNEQAPPQPAWLEYRLGFFVEACRASMSRQDPAVPFRWLVFFDDRCAPEFREEIEDLAAGVFEPIWTHDVFWSGVAKRAVGERATAPYVITTRLDSDDAVAKNYLAAIQDEFDSQDFLYVNFARGLQVVRGGAVYQLDYASNPFVSLIEKRSEGDVPFTIFGFGQHNHVRRMGPLREVVADPMWIQVIHGSNIGNEVRGRRISPHRYDHLFDVDLGYDHHPTAGRLLKDSARRWVDALRLGVRHPRVPHTWVLGRVDRIRGTRTKARLESSGVTSVKPRDVAQPAPAAPSQRTGRRCRARRRSGSG